jgi:hypothetical protein
MIGASTEVQEVRMHEMLAVAAYHEAGHAVRMWWLQRELVEVEIDLERPGAGFCTAPSLTRGLLQFGAPVSWVRVHDDITCCQAGPLAELRYRRSRVNGLLAPEGSEDAARAWEVLNLWEQARNGHAAHTGLMLSLIQQATLKFVQRPKTWKAVEALASALLDQGHLAGEDAERIIREAYGRRGVPLHWREPARWSDPRIDSLLDTMENQHRSPLA